MTQTTHGSFDLVERQEAFVGLLTTPLLTRDLDPPLHRLVTRHRQSLSRWAGQLGYRLVGVGTTFRLRRSSHPGVPVEGPADSAQDRRILVLLLVLAAVLEEIRSDTVGIQPLSDAVRDTVAVQGLTEYDPGRRADRRLLVAALRKAESHGVLRRLTREELLDTWEAAGEGVGGGYLIDRHALFLLVDPVDLAAARDTSPPEEDAPRDPHTPDPRAQRLLRQLVETQGIELAGLAPEDREYWRGQRHRLIARAGEYTGGSVELTGDTATLILPAGHRFSRAATDPFPAAKAAHWVTLRLLDLAGREGTRHEDGRLGWASADVDRGCEAISADLGDRLPADLRGAPLVIRTTAERTLSDLGLLEVEERGWSLSPLAARYRSASLTVGATTKPTTLEDDS